jgi:hypothetical protein
MQTVKTDQDEKQAIPDVGRADVVWEGPGLPAAEEDRAA